MKIRCGFYPNWRFGAGRTYVKQCYCIHLGYFSIFIRVGGAA